MCHLRVTACPCSPKPVAVALMLSRYDSARSPPVSRWSGGQYESTMPPSLVIEVAGFRPARVSAVRIARMSSRSSCRRWHSTKTNRRIKLLGTWITNRVSGSGGAALLLGRTSGLESELTASVPNAHVAGAPLLIALRDRRPAATSASTQCLASACRARRQAGRQKC
jgi:hypothetical protein